MENLRFKLSCECCGKVYDMPRTEEIPADVTAMACNFCIECEDKMNDYYDEWVIDEPKLPIVHDPNQMELF